jgi:hypothetical protein
MRLLLWSSTTVLSRGVPERVALAVFGLHREGNFLESNLSGFCSGGSQQVRKAPQEIVLCSGDILETPEHHVGVDQLLSSTFYFLQSKIKYGQSKNCSARNHPTRGNPGLMHTLTDVILKKMD